MIPTADRSKGTVTVRIGLDQKDARILPEMGVRVSFLADTPQDAGGKPRGRRDSAEQRGAGDRAPPASCSPCTATPSSGARCGSAAGGSGGITVLSGLAAGERVAVGDFNQFKDGAKIRVEP